jgi:hypothetical protein
MKRWGLLWVGLCSLALVAPALAQEGPKGPADIIKRATQAREKPPVLLPDGTPADSKPTPATGTQLGRNADADDQPEQAPLADDEQPPVGDDPHAHQAGAPPLARRPLSEAQPSADVASGAIRVKVLDASERPVSDAQLQLGTMSQESGRTSTQAKTGPDGMFVFSNLPGGDKLAYRVNVLHQGAKYSSTPFRLPPDRGFDVVIRQIDVTKDAREVVLYVGATSVELKDERLRVVQQARLVNIGAKTYVFPEAGTQVRFPKGFVAFQAEEIMTDQHLKEAKDEGMRITGSLPPGEVTLTWGFDLPQTDTTAELSFDLPWTTFAYRVLADAAPGMTLSVDDMPAPELHEDRGRHLLVTEVVKRVGDQPLKVVHIKLTGIPGPGPLRFIAVGLALCVLGLGIFVSRPSGATAAASGNAATAHDLELEKERLLERARELETEHARGEIGPEFHKTARVELEEQLSGVLYEQQRLAQQSKSARPAR